jgi:PAS domain S-box-containing protein
MSLRDVVAVSLYNHRFEEIHHEQKPEEFPPAPRSEIDLLSLRSVIVRETAEHMEFIGPVMLQAEQERDESLYFDVRERVGPGRPIGSVRIILSKDNYHREIAAVAKQNALIMFAFIGASVLIVTFAVRKVTRPLVNLTEKVKALGMGLPVEPVPVETGDEVGNLAATFNDMVRARGQAEQLLRESEERYRRLVELSPDAIYVQQRGTIVFINASGARLLGASGPPEITGRPAAGFVQENCRALLDSRLSRVEKEGVPLSPVEVRYVQKNGTFIEAEIAAAPFTFSGANAALVIARDQTERKGMEEQIRSYQKELYSAALEMSSLESRVEERERHLIAADLHDYVGQNLAILIFKIARLQATLTKPEAPGNLQAIRDILEQTIQYTRSLTAELNPPVLAEIGLKPAVESLAETFQNRHGIRIAIRDEGGTDQLPAETRYLLFRCVRELLMNVVKHSRASEANITIGSDGAELQVTVADNGAGFDPNRPGSRNSGFGLFSIRERVKGIGGSCEVVTGPGRGTTVYLKAPVRAPEGKDEYDDQDSSCRRP